MQTENGAVTVKSAAYAKGWTLTAIGERWSLTKRQMSRIAHSSRQRDLDAIAGLPPANGAAVKQGASVSNIANSKKWGKHISLLAERWGLSERQLARVLKSTKQRDIDAANGLPRCAD